MSSSAILKNCRINDEGSDPQTCESLLLFGSVQRKSAALRVVAMILGLINGRGYLRRLASALDPEKKLGAMEFLEKVSRVMEACPESELFTASFNREAWYSKSKRHIARRRLLAVRNKMKVKINLIVTCLYIDKKVL